MSRNDRFERLRSPEQRVGTLPNADLPPPGPDDPDEQLLQRAFGYADESAFEQVLDRLYSPMLTTAMQYVQTQADAEEVIQETWLAGLRNFSRFEHRSSIKTWLFRILRYRAMSHGRRAARYVSFSELGRDTRGRGDGWVERLTSADGAGARSAQDPERAFLAREFRGKLDQALMELPDRQRRTLVLRDLKGWTAQEVCEALGVSEGNQRVLLHRARNRIRSELRDYVFMEETSDAAGNRMSGSG